jgi:hypothetical protein
MSYDVIGILIVGLILNLCTVANLIYWYYKNRF